MNVLVCNLKQMIAGSTIHPPAVANRESCPLFPKKRRTVPLNIGKQLMTVFYGFRGNESPVAFRWDLTA